MEVVELASRAYELDGHNQDQPALIVLHGLLGDGSNLAGLAKALQDEYRVFLLDLRNHGKSAHHPDMDFAVMAADVLAWMQSHQLKQAIILGHSLGGKVAMQFALQYPDMCSALLVEDISPSAYPAHHDKILDALESLSLSQLHSRQQADQCLADSIEDPGLRSFLLKNLVFKDGAWKWRCNLAAIKDNYANLRAEVNSESRFEKPCLFIKGELSSYLTPEDQPGIARLFPEAELKIILGAGHWCHSEKPHAFQRVVKDFLHKI